LRVIPLGGLGEVGRNMTLLEYENSILIMDMGFRMPGEDMPGIDYIIPNIDYLKNKVKISSARFSPMGTMTTSAPSPTSLKRSGIRDSG
jgi:Predicted hydrolase of the metallo-beta-lactamase superfamily